MKASISLKGLEDTLNGFHDLGEKAKGRIIRNAARTGARSLKRALKEAAPSGSGAERSVASKKYGNLKSNIKESQLRGAKFLPYYRVTTGDAFWGRFLDVGTGKHNVDPGPRARGAAARTHILPTFWFRRTVEQQRQPVLGAMVVSIRASLKREFARLKKV